MGGEQHAPVQGPSGPAPAHAVPHAGAERHRLEFLDGIRALAALHVLLYHALAAAADTGNTGLPAYMTRLVPHGHMAVSVFIVLSGYCLTVPVARSGKLQIVGGFGRYIRRRFFRIFPAYYFVLFLSVAANVLFALVASLAGVQRPAPLTAADIVAHAAMVHNWWLPLHASISGALWSVATEWQIYFAFPLLLLAMRTVRGLPTVLSAYAIGLLPYYLLPDGHNLAWAHPWFLGLFALGAYGALQRWNQRWAVLTVGSSLALVLLYVAGLLHDWPGPLGEGLIGLAICGAMVCLASGHLPALRRLLGHTVVARVAAASYTLYLIHPLVLKCVTAGLVVLHQGGMSLALGRALLGVPLSVCIAVVLARYIETPFIGREGWFCRRSVGS